MKKNEKKLQLSKVRIARLSAVLTTDKKKNINGGFDPQIGTTFIRIFC
jgi:hypothetical protein